MEKDKCPCSSGWGDWFSSPTLWLTVGAALAASLIGFWPAALFGAGAATGALAVNNLAGDKAKSDNG
jgi:hypothetical protein